MKDMTHLRGIRRSTQPIVCGRRISVQTSGVKTVRSIIREHLRYAGLTIKHDLARMLGITPVGAASLMTKKHPLAPQHIDVFIEAMKLDEFDALELRLRGAIEAGWQVAALVKHTRI